MCKGKDCFECGDPAQHEHHVVPRVRGGTKTIPLCLKCHEKCHDKKMAHPDLIKAGLRRARERGVDMNKGHRRQARKYQKYLDEMKPRMELFEGFSSTEVALEFARRRLKTAKGNHSWTSSIIRKMRNKI